jgi:hypothetical protein
MKSILVASMFLMMSGFAFAQEESEKVVVSCEEKYQIIYDGETSGYFAGVSAKHSVFFIKATEGAKVSAMVEINTEGGKLIAEYAEKYDDKSGKAIETKQMIYDEGWGQKTLTVSTNGKVLEKLKCKSIE